MKIVREYPPNYAEIKAAFNPPIDVLFCYGSTIFNPAGERIAPELIIHEGVHSRRQGGDPAGWWKRYIENQKFRLDEEVVAHQAEYRVLRIRNQNTDHVIKRLCSPLYGSMINLEEAARLIRGHR